MDIVFVKHGTSKEYCFYVPKELVTYVKKGIPVLVETKGGLDMGETTTDVVSGDGAVDIAMRNGAYFPLKPIISVVNDNVKEYIENRYLNYIRGKLYTRIPVLIDNEILAASGQLPF